MTVRNRCTLRLLLGAAMLLTLSLVPIQARARSKTNPICQKLGVSLQASSGAQMFCFGPQLNGSTNPLAAVLPSAGTANFTANTDAASLTEDVSPAGVRGYGQSETSIASTGPYVVEAWNDATGFFSNCGAPKNKEELTGFAFSNDGGATFTDLGGLPNSNCQVSKWVGDPSIEVYQAGGHTYFYISSIFIPFNIPQNELAITACEVLGIGSSARLSCSQPIIAAISSDCVTTPEGFVFCSFLDKEFLTIDRQRGRLYMSYTEFGVSANFFGQIEVAKCNLQNPAVPVCTNGSLGQLNPPFLVVKPGDPNCEREGAYPAVDPVTGNLYIAHEFNWATNIFNGACFSTLTQEVLSLIPSSCLTGRHSACSPPFTEVEKNIVSMDAAFIPGYNRFPMNDFPRIAVSSPFGTVSIVWNDARSNPLGNILLQSYTLGGLAPLQSSPVKLNNDACCHWHFMPAVRYATSAGLLKVSWYDRRRYPDTAQTDVFATLGVSPTATGTPTSNARVTDIASDWILTSSDIIPNFGDYTDNYIAPSGSFYVAWSDGRVGEPQPFEAKQK